MIYITTMRYNQWRGAGLPAKNILFMTLFKAYGSLPGRIANYITPSNAVAMGDRWPLPFALETGKIFA